MIAFKILLGSELAALINCGRFEGTSSDLEEGFIHLSSADQLDRVVKKHYPDTADVHIVAVNLETQAKRSNGKRLPVAKCIPTYMAR